MTVVFAVLIALSLIIQLSSMLILLFEKSQKKTGISPEPSVPLIKKLIKSKE